MQQIPPLLLHTSARNFCSRCVTREPNYGVCCGEINSQWGCFSLHIAVGPPFNFHFSDPKSVLSVLNSLHLRFLSLYCPDALLPKETLNMGFTVIKYAFIRLVVCNPDLSRICNIKNNLSKSNLSLHIRCMHFHVTVLLRNLRIFWKISWPKSLWSNFTRWIMEMPLSW
jgi:hypothetical protein